MIFILESLYNHQHWIFNLRGIDLDIMELAGQLPASKLEDTSGSGNTRLAQAIIGGLLGGSGKQGIGLGSIVGNLQNSGLGDIACVGIEDNSHP